MVAIHICDQNNMLQPVILLVVSFQHLVVAKAFGKECSLFILIWLGAIDKFRVAIHKEAQYGIFLIIQGPLGIALSSLYLKIVV